MEMDTKLFPVPHCDESGSQQHTNQDIQFTIDKSTGSLIIIQDSSGRNQENVANATGVECKRGVVLSDHPSSSSGLSREALDFLEQVLHDDGDAECVLETETEQITFHSVEEEQVPFDMQGVIPTDQAEAHMKKRGLWTPEEVTDFLQCVLNNEHRIRKSTKIKSQVWNDIAMEMRYLGHSHQNKDQCAKKWNNLYRTWRKVRNQGRDARSKWIHYEQMSTVTKAIYTRGQKMKQVNKNKSPSLKDMLKVMIEQNLRFQSSICKAEESFQEQAATLNKQRDLYIKEINEALNLQSQS